MQFWNWKHPSFLHAPWIILHFFLLCCEASMSPLGIGFSSLDTNNPWIKLTLSESSNLCSYVMFNDHFEGTRYHMVCQDSFLTARQRITTCKYILMLCSPFFVKFNTKCFKTKGSINIQPFTITHMNTLKYYNDSLLLLMLSRGYSTSWRLKRQMRWNLAKLFWLILFSLLIWN